MSCWRRVLGLALAFLAAAAAPSVRALNPERRADGYSVRGWFTEHGLPSNKIRALTQTTDGYLWIATAQGVARFDGNRFTVFNGATHPELRGGGFFAMVEAPDGTLWFGGDTGLFRWRGERFERFTTADGLADNYVRTLTLARDGRVVACTRRGFSFIRDGRITTPQGIWREATGTARAYLERADGSVYLGTDDGLWRIADGAIERLSGRAGLPASGYNSLLDTPDGAWWIGHQHGVRGMRADGTHQDFGAADGLAAPRVASLCRDRDGNLWIATIGGLYRSTGGKLEPATRPDDPAGITTIQQLYEDRDGALWVASAVGLFRIEDNIATAIGTREGLKQTSVYSVVESTDGAWWIGLWGGGVYRYQNGRATPLAAPAPGAFDQTIALAAAPDGSVWIGAVDGLHHHSGGATRNLFSRELAPAWRAQLAANPRAVLPGLAHPRVNAIAVEPDGALWVATDGALYHGRAGAFQAHTRADGLPGDSFKAVLRARNGDVWASAPPAGVARRRGGTWEVFHAGRELADVYPRGLYEDEAGAIWVATDGGGLNRFKDGRWRVFTSADGLADDFVSGMREDDHGNYWIAFPRGIMRIPRVQFEELEAGRRTRLQPRIFDRYDGLPAAESNQQGSPSLTRAGDGRLLLATDRGVAVIEPAQVRRHDHRPAVRLERVLIGGVAADLARPLVVPPGGRDVEVHYTAISLVAPEKVRFKVRLAPLDHDWVETTRRDVRYAQLPPGNYTFHVLASNRDGVWNDAGPALAFEVQPTFFETGWFLALLGLGVIALVLGVAGMRARLARRGMERLEHVVEERTRELQIAKDAAESAVLARNEIIATLERARAELADERNRFKFIFEALPVGVMWMFVGRIESRMVNPAYQRISGVPESRSRVLGAYPAATHPEDRARQEELRAQLLAGTIDHYTIEKRYIHPDGSLRWAELSVRVFHSSIDGGIQEISTLVDRTERKQAEAELRWKTALLEAQLDASPDGILVVDAAGRRMLQNELFAELWSIPPEIARHPDTAEQVRLVREQPKDLPAFLEKVEHLYAHPEATSRDEIELKSGRVLDRYSSPVRGRDGTHYGRIWVVRDITAQKRAHAALTSSHSLLHATLESTMDGILVVDGDGRIAAHNQKFAAMWNVAPELLAQGDVARAMETVLVQLKEPERFVAKVRELYAQTEAESFDLLEFKDGRVFERYSQPQRVDGRTVGRVWCFRDVSERKRSENALAKAHRQLIDASRQAGMAEVATGVLHNVGNVLNSVNVSATLITGLVRQSRIGNVARLGDLLEANNGRLAEFFTSDPRGTKVPAYVQTLSAHLAREQADVIAELDSLRKNVEHIKDIVAMQQSYAKVSGVTEWVAVVELVEDALRMSGAQGGEAPVQRAFEASPTVLTEKHKVLQILVNLLRNAKHACDEADRPEKAIAVRVTTESGRVRISVVDNGVGIPRENLTRIFSHGFTTRKHGHGFGLHSGAIAAKELGGALTARSEGPGRGAVFTLELPLGAG